VYAIFADYVESHPAILPKAYFESVTVEQGGRGAGTVVRVQMTAKGGKRAFRLVVSEPEPGRVLVEADDQAGVVTTFTVDPVDDGARSHVTIATDLRRSPGLRGWVERLANPLFLGRVYRQELALVAAYAGRAGGA
jgi:hypothetical protein